MVVLMPAGLPRAEERRLITDMLGRLARSGRRKGHRASDADLMRRATELSTKWLEGRARPASVRWVPAMTTRWASCSPDSGELRISETLRDVPAYVLDYVVMHELVHLVVPGGHPPEFWEVVRRYPRTERAMGYLEAYSRVLRQGAGSDAPGGGRGPSARAWATWSRATTTRPASTRSARPSRRPPIRPRRAAPLSLNPRSLTPPESEPSEPDPSEPDPSEPEP